MAVFAHYDSAWGSTDHYSDYANGTTMSQAYPGNDYPDYSNGAAMPQAYPGTDPQGLWRGAPFAGPTGPRSGQHDAYWGGKGRQTLLMGNLHRGRNEQYGHFTNKVPPWWEPTDEKWYPYHVWVRDLDMWCAQTELHLEKRGPSVC